MPPLTPSEWTAVVAMLLIFTTLLWMLPSCGDPECRSSHERHSVARRAAEIERKHNTFHGPTAPDPLCPLCQARKRDDA